LRRLSDDSGYCITAIERDLELEGIFAIGVVRPYCQRDGEFGTADRFYVTYGSPLAVGVVFVQSVAVDVNRNAHMGQAVCAHGGSDVVVS
jgi:hypothetical protein